MSQIHSIKLTTKDAKVNRWLKNQNNKSRSLELAIKLMIARYGDDDLFNGAITRLLADETAAREEVVETATETIEPEVEKKSVVKKKTSKKSTPMPEQEQDDVVDLDPRALLRASGESEDKSKQDDGVIDMSEDDILNMFSNQSQKL